MTIYAVNGKEPVAAWIPSLDTAGNGTTTLTDLVGSNNGTLTNMDAATDWVADTGSGGVRALDFDGSNDQIICPQINFTTSVSISAWIYPRNTSLFGYVAGCNGTSAANSSFALRVYLNKLQLVCYVGSTATVLYSGTLTANVWSHAVGWYSKTTEQIGIYLNGVATSPIAATGVLNTPATAFTIGGRVGGYSGSGMQDGRIDDVRLFSGVDAAGAISASDVSYLYNSGNGRGRVAASMIRRQQRSQQIIS